MNKPIRFALTLLALLPCSAFGLHRETPQFQVVSSLNPGSAPSQPGLGESKSPFSQGGLAGWCAFESTADLKGMGANFAGGQQIYLFDNNPDHGGRHIYQITNKAGTSGNPSVTGTGSIMAFDSDARLLNQGPVGVKQIYTYTRVSQTTTQRTFGDKDSFNPVINQRGKAMVFLSKADLLGTGATGTHLFLWRDNPACIIGLGCGHLHQMTPPGNSTTNNPTFSPENAGNIILFDSDAAIEGPANGRRQLFMYDMANSKFTRLTNFTTGDSVRPTMSITHRWVTFQSNADPLGNGSNGWEIYLMDLENNNAIRQITDSPMGDSIEPSLAVNAGYVLYVSTSDILLNGSHQRNVFFSDLRTGNTYQMTKDSTDPAHPADSRNPVAAGDRLFFFDTTAKLFGVGNGYRQVVGMNVFNWLPGPALGNHEFSIKPGTTVGGSKASIKTSLGSTVVDLDAGKMAIAFGARATDGQAAVNIAAADVALPPIPMAGFGALCIVPTGDGAGTIDCLGGHEDLNTAVVQDHYADPEDPFCVLGCREGETCSGPLPGGHVRACDYCMKRCVGGSVAGALCDDSDMCDGGICQAECSADSLLSGTACTNDPAICNPVEACADGFRGVCVGPEVTNNKYCRGGTNIGKACLSANDCGGADCSSDDFGPGAARLTLPVSVKLSNDAGLDGKYCTNDDTFPVAGLPANLNLTTGTSKTEVKGMDAVNGTDISTSLVGQPFECNELADGNTNGATFVATLHFLNVPIAPVLRDIQVGLSLSSGECTTNCPIPCTSDVECTDGNACTGVETCGLDGYCKAGQLVICSDSDACNGLETCDPADGTCHGGTPPVCDDSNACTTDSCAAASGCIHIEKDCQNGNLCDGTETCNPATGACQAGVALTCDDSKPCNGVESCSPQYGCLSGNPIVCSDGNACNGLETCDDSDGSCHGATALVCDDGSACNGVEFCDPVAGCQPGASVQCADGNACNGTESCNPSTGACEGGTALACDDGNNCTDDSCDTATGCVHTPEPSYKGIRCLLNLMVGDLNPLPNGSAMTPKVQAKLRRMVARVIGRVDAAERSSIKFRVRHARHGVKVCQGISRTVMAAEAVGKCTGPVCDEIQNLANVASQAIQPLTSKP